MNSARLKDQACSPNCTVHIPVPAESPVEKTTHHFLITEGSPNSCSIVTALLLHVLGLPFAICASFHPEAG